MWVCDCCESADKAAGAGAKGDCAELWEKPEPCKSVGAPSPDTGEGDGATGGGAMCTGNAACAVVWDPAVNAGSCKTVGAVNRSGARSPDDGAGKAVSRKAAGGPATEGSKGAFAVLGRFG